MDIDGFLEDAVKPMIENDEKANEVLVAKGKSGREKIVDGGMAEESVTVDGGIKNLNEGVDDGGVDTTTGIVLKLPMRGFPPSLNQHQALGHLRGHYPWIRRLLG